MDAAPAREASRRWPPSPGRAGRRRTDTAPRGGSVGSTPSAASHVIQPLGAVVVRRQRVVVDRPGRRHAVEVFDRLEVLAPQPIEHAAPELRVPADAVVRVGRELPPALVEPALRGAIAELFPDRLGIPVFLFLGNEVAALDDENPCRTSARAPARWCRRPRRCR